MMTELEIVVIVIEGKRFNCYHNRHDEEICSAGELAGILLPFQPEEICLAGQLGSLLYSSAKTTSSSTVLGQRDPKAEVDTQTSVRRTQKSMVSRIFMISPSTILLHFSISLWRGNSRPLAQYPQLLIYSPTPLTEIRSVLSSSFVTCL